MSAQDRALIDQAETAAPINMGDMAHSLGFLLRIAQLQTFERFFETLGRHGLKPGEFTVLWVIGHNPGLRQGTVAGHLRIKPAHMTKLTARLVDRGLVTRATPADDRRAVRLTLTEEGHRLLTDNRDAFLSHELDGTSNLTPDEADMLRGLLKKMTGTL